MDETPQAAARRLAASALRDGYKPEALHTYSDAAGAPLYWRIRAKHPSTGEKWIRPMHLNGNGYELGEPAFAGKKPLYRLDDLTRHPDAVVYLVEGEKAADALAKLGAIVTTSGGAGSAEAADWEPLRGRRVKLWPDNDDAGKGYAGTVAAILLGELGCKVSAIDVERLNLPAKGDAWDWLHTHREATPSDLEALPVRAARPLACNAIASDGDGVALIRADSIQPEPIRWLWEGWLAGGKFHVIAGQAGSGKTTLALAYAATITTGGRWPDGSRAGVGNVLMWSGEDDAGDTLVPRLLAMGADTSRVHFVGAVRDGQEIRPFDPARDVPALTLAAARIGDIKMLIVDPVVLAVAGDSHKNAETRRSLQPLVDLASKLDCAVLGVTHLSKGTSGREPIERVTGSLAFGALARVVLLTAKLPADENKPAVRLLIRGKSNIGPDDGGYQYELIQSELETHAGIIASSVIWGAAIEGTARELLATAEAVNDDETASQSPRQFLAQLLKSGPKLASEIFDEADAHGYSKRQMQRACKSLGAVVRKLSMDDGWQWRLSEDAEDAEDTALERLAPSAPSVGDSVEDAEDTKLRKVSPSESSAPSSADDHVDDCEVF